VSGVGGVFPAGQQPAAHVEDGGGICLVQLREPSTPGIGELGSQQPEPVTNKKGTYRFSRGAYAG
jgi:hypothetical protein